MEEEVAVRQAHHCHSRRERKRQPDFGDNQIFKWAVDDADVRGERLVDVDRVVREAPKLWTPDRVRFERPPMAGRNRLNHRNASQPINVYTPFAQALGSRMGVRARDALSGPLTTRMTVIQLASGSITSMIEAELDHPCGFSPRAIIRW